MTDLIYDYITTGVDMVMYGAVLSSIIMILYTTSRLSVEVSNSQATAETLNYYMEFNQFDDKDVLASDVIGTLIRYSPDLELVVNGCDGGVIHTYIGDPNIYQGDGKDHPIKKSAKALTEIIYGDTEYHSTIVSVGDTAGIGSIKGIIFTKK